MANRWMPKGAEKLLQGQINLLTDTIKVVLLENTYTLDLTDEFLSDIAAHVLDTPVALTSRSVTGGVFDAADFPFEAVASGDTTNAVMVIKDTGVAATSPVLIYLDEVTNFPALTNGGDVDITWDSGAYKIFSMVP